MRHFEEFLNNVNVVWLLVTDQYSLRPETFMEFANDESKVTFLFFLIFEPWIICGMPNAPQVVNWSFAHVVMIPQDKGRKMTSLIFWLSKSFQESSLQDALLLQADLLAKLFCPLLLSLQDISVVVLLLSHFYVKAVVSVSTQWLKNQQHCLKNEKKNTPFLCCYASIVVKWDIFEDFQTLCLSLPLKMDGLNPA